MISPVASNVLSLSHIRYEEPSKELKLSTELVGSLREIKVMAPHLLVVSHYENFPMQDTEDFFFFFFFR